MTKNEILCFINELQCYLWQYFILRYYLAHCISLMKCFYFIFLTKYIFWHDDCSHWEYEQNRLHHFFCLLDHPCLERKLLYIFCWFCWFSCVHSWNNNSLNISLDIFIIIQKSKLYANFIHDIKIYNPEIAQFWYRIAKIL